MRNGHTKSCGCYHIDKITKHGLRYTKLYNVHKAMIDRCYKMNHDSYVNYGGRGIAVCDEWLDSINGTSDFTKWAKENGYETGLTLDRIDNDGNYEPNNCRWVDYKVQNNNTRATVKIEINESIKTLTEWSEISGVNKNTIRDRIRRGWSGEDLLIPSLKTKINNNHQ